MNYFTSDTHFGHEPIISFCNRPYSSIYDMEEGLINGINQCVTSNDVLYLLGDFSFTSGEYVKSIVRRIKCPIVLIRGNHDYQIRKRRDYGFADVYKEFDLAVGNYMVTLSHYPFKGDHTAVDRYTDKRPKDFGQWLLHGHVHTMWKIKREERMINVGCDVWGWKPISELDIINIIEGKV